MKVKPAELILSLAVLLLGVAVAVGAAQLSGAGGYARIGPNVSPAVISGGLILLGCWLVYEALTGGWRNSVPENPLERGEHPFRWPAFFWISVGLGLQVLLIHRAGFAIAQAALFACVARGFGSARLIRDGLLGFGLGVAVYLFFVKFLNVSLPAGWLAPILGGAGI
jgi:putative tricarboxylic transport membrane protein